MDGTLAETEERGHLRAFNQAFNELGFADYWSLDHYRDLLKVAGGKERIQHYWRLTAHPEAENWELITRVHRCKTQIYTSLVSGGEISLRPGVAELLAGARQLGLALGIATTTSRINFETLIQATLGGEALNWFRVIGCAENSPVKKPAPDVYQLVLKQLDLPADQVCAFEDNHNGLRAANAAGIGKVVITPTFLSQQEDFSGAWQVLEDLTRFDVTRMAGPRN